jgi:hypothetical protein
MNFWELLIENFEDIFVFIINNYGWVYAIMVALIIGILELVKWPYKKLTSKVKSEVVRKLLNKAIILFSFVISFVLYYFGNIILPNYINCNTITIIGSALFSNIIYALGDGVINGSKAKKLAEAITNLDENNDGKVSLEEASNAMKKFDDDLDNI